jgi:hypothetical protein
MQLAYVYLVKVGRNSINLRIVPTGELCPDLLKPGASPRTPGNPFS